MVQTVLHKEYTQESCMAMLTYIPREYNEWEQDQKDSLRQVQELCKDVILQSLVKRVSVTNFGIDSSTDRIEKWIKQNKNNRPQLDNWLKAKKLNFSVTTLLFSAENAGLRSLAIIELGIP